MATTTPNYGWPVPTSTDYVKDGALAIETLGDAIDATVFGLGTSSFNLISNTSFSAVATHSVSDVFSATYNNYKIIVKSVASGAGVQLRMRLRVAGADNTSSNYVFGTGVTNSAGGFSNNNSSTGTTSFYTADVYEKNTNLMMDIYSPFASTNTGYQTKGQSQNSVDACANQFGGGAMTVTTSYTGFTLFPSANTMTGNVTVYGYNS